MFLLNYHRNIVIPKSWEAIPIGGGLLPQAPMVATALRVCPVRVRRVVH